MVFRISGEVTVTSCTVLVFIVNSFNVISFKYWTLYNRYARILNANLWESERVKPDPPPGRTFESQNEKDKRQNECQYGWFSF